MRYETPEVLVEKFATKSLVMILTDQEGPNLDDPNNPIDRPSLY